MKHFGYFPSRRDITDMSSSCGEQDDGEYISPDQMYDKPDPQPMWVEGCSTWEFKHIGNVFDMGE